MITVDVAFAVFPGKIADHGQENMCKVLDNLMTVPLRVTVKSVSVHVVAQAICKMTDGFDVSDRSLVIDHMRFFCDAYNKLRETHKKAWAAHNFILKSFYYTCAKKPEKIVTLIHQVNALSIGGLRASK